MVYLYWYTALFLILNESKAIKVYPKKEWPSQKSEELHTKNITGTIMTDGHPQDTAQGNSTFGSQDIVGSGARFHH